MPYPTSVDDLDPIDAADPDPTSGRHLTEAEKSVLRILERAHALDTGRLPGGTDTEVGQTVNTQAANRLAHLGAVERWHDGYAISGAGLDYLAGRTTPAGVWRPPAGMSAANRQRLERGREEAIATHGSIDAAIAAAAADATERRAAQDVADSLTAVRADAAADAQADAEYATVTWIDS